jgi:hypothetical protein
LRLLRDAPERERNEESDGAGGSECCFGARARQLSSPLSGIFTLRRSFLRPLFIHGTCLEREISESESSWSAARRLNRSECSFRRCVGKAPPLPPPPLRAAPSPPSRVAQPQARAWGLQLEGRGQGRARRGLASRRPPPPPVVPLLPRGPLPCPLLAAPPPPAQGVACGAYTLPYSLYFYLHVYYSAVPLTCHHPNT